jgi:hypothetical protein
MPVLWSCPKPDCPPTENAPRDVPESGEAADAESEPPFTTDEVAALLNVPRDAISEWHKEGTASGLSDAQGEPLPKGRYGPVVVGARGIARDLPERLRWDLQAKCIHDG